MCDARSFYILYYNLISYGANFELYNILVGILTKNNVKNLGLKTLN